MVDHGCEFCHSKSVKSPLKKFLLWSDFASYSLVRISQIFFAVFFSATLDNTSSASAKCRSTIGLSSISFHLQSSMASAGLFLIAANQLSFLKIAFIFIFHGEKSLSLNFSISNFVVSIISPQKWSTSHLRNQSSDTTVRIVSAIWR